MGWLRGIGGYVLISCWQSPAIMRKRPVSLGHAVRILALLDGVSPAVRGVEQLGREPLGHGLFVTLARGRDDPADAERLAARRANLDRHLVGRPADAPRAHLDAWHHIFERLLEDGDGVLLDLTLDEVERAVDDALGHRLLPGAHDHV